MDDLIFYLGYEDAEQQAKLDQILGKQAYVLDAGCDPEDYMDWGVSGMSVEVFDFVDSTPDYIQRLEATLSREGASSVQISTADESTGDAA